MHAITDCASITGGRSSRSYASTAHCLAFPFFRYCGSNTAGQNACPSFSSRISGAARVCQFLKRLSHTPQDGCQSFPQIPEMVMIGRVPVTGGASGGISFSIDSISVWIDWLLIVELLLFILPP